MGGGLGYVQEGMFLHICLASVKIKKPFSSHCFTLQEYPLQQTWLTKPLQQLGTLQTRQAGGGFLHLPSVQRAHGSSRQLTALSCHQLHIIIPQQAAMPPAQKVGSAGASCLATRSGMALIPCAAKQAWALPSVWCCWWERRAGHTMILLKLTSSRSGSLLWILFRVSSTSVEFGSSSGTGLYCVGLITPAGEKQDGQNQN